MRISDFDLYKDILKERSGLLLTADKSYLLDSRLTPIARKWKFSSLSSMTMNIRGVPDHDLVTEVVEAMANTETSFFRDLKPFESFRDTVLPHLMKKRRRKRARILCAGCSTGQEPYSLAMILKEQAGKLGGWTFDILAIDLSSQALEIAKKAAYSQIEVQHGLPIWLLVKYFDQKEDHWALKPAIKSMVQFKQFNLLDSMHRMDDFDIIFCRNVLNGLDPAAQNDILHELMSLLPDDGFVFLGAGETLPKGFNGLAPLENVPGIFIKA